MKKLKKLVLGVLCVTTVMGSSLTAMAADTTDITNSSENKSAEIELVVEIDSSFTVGIPIKADLDKKTGQGSYNVTLSGDLDPRYKLVVAPVDSYTQELGDTTTNVNFLLKDKASTLNPKSDIVVDITPGKTEFICTDITPDVSTTITNTMAVSSGKLSAGKWQGVIKYSISLELIN